jgi:hypothetical protein
VSRNISSLVAVTGLGTALIHLAVGAGSPLPFLIIFVAFGVSELAWSVATFLLGRVPAPRAFVIVTLAPVVVWAASVTLGVAGILPLGPLAAASLLGVAAAGVVLFSLRRAGAREAIAQPSDSSVTADSGNTADSGEHPWRFIGTLAASAAIIAGIVTPALSGTHAGQYAVPHGTHGDLGIEVDEHSGH